jgi:signal transduction histidine kinase
MFDTSHLVEYLTTLPLLQVPGSLLQSALNEGLRIARAESGLLFFFDFEEGLEAGQDIDALRSFIAAQAAQAIKKQLQPRSEQHPISLWLPKGPALMETSVKGMSRRILVLPMNDPHVGQPSGVMLLLMPKTDLGGQVSLNIGMADRANLQAFGKATINAWLSVRYLTNMSRRLEDLDTLNKVASVISSNLDLPELLKQITHTARLILHSSACTLMLIDQSTNELVFSIPDGEFTDKLLEYRQPVGQGISGYVARTKEPVIVNDVTKDPRFSRTVDTNTGFVTKALMCAPMVVRGKTIGVIQIINKEDGTLFNPNDMRILLTLAAQSAIAIENAQLYAQLKDERDKLVAKEEEVRRELGRDLHDGPAQVISQMAMRADFIKKLYLNGNEKDRLMSELNELERVALKTAKDIRTMLFGLRPVILETQGLIPALETFKEKLQTETWETHLVVRGFGEPADYFRLPYNTEITAFIIIQEAITNIRKYAQPNNVWIVLERSEEETVITVSDDGAGFDAETTLSRYDERGSFGLLNMRDRARLINATFEIQSKPGAGTKIILNIKHETTQRTGEFSTLQFSTLNPL